MVSEKGHESDDILQCLSLFTQVIKKKRGTCFQIPRSRARYVERRVLPAVSAAAATTATAEAAAAGAWSLRLGLIDSQRSPP